MNEKKSNKTGEIKQQFLNNQKYWDTVLKKEFEKETDRGAVIFASSLFDAALKNLLISFLVTNSNSSDDLFDSVNSPLSTFSSKISFAYRLGLISDKFARDLNLIRKIRNEFAHNIQGSDFNHSSIRSRVSEINKSSNIIDKMSAFDTNIDRSLRNCFLQSCSWMLTSIHNKIEEVKPISASKKEFGYVDTDIIKDFKKFLDENPHLLKKKDELEIKNK